MTTEHESPLPESIPAPEPAPAPEAPVAPAAPAAPEATMEDTIRETYKSLTRPAPERGPDGRFLRTSEPEPTEAPGDTGEGAEAPIAAPAPPPEPKPWDAAPNTWRKEIASEYGALPESVRQEIHRREEDFHKGISQYRDAAAFGHSMFEDVAPHFDAIRQTGATPKDVVRDVMNAWRALATGTADQKRDTLLRLADGYGISLDELMESRYREPPSAPEIAPVLQRLQRLESTITESQRAREEAERAERISQAQKFLSDPAREHIEAVFDDVVALVRAGKTPEQAYEQAIWAHPETRAKLIAKQDDERRQREAEQAAAARKAAAANVARRGTPPAATPPGSMDDTARQAYRRLMGH